eukprot:jgi/Tetstr1/464512/TSEL_009270.t1
MDRTQHPLVVDERSVAYTGNTVCAAQPSTPQATLSEQRPCQPSISSASSPASSSCSGLGRLESTAFVRDDATSTPAKDHRKSPASRLLVVVPSDRTPPGAPPLGRSYAQIVPGAPKKRPRADGDELPASRTHAKRRLNFSSCNSANWRFGTDARQLAVWLADRSAAGTH